MLLCFLYNCSSVCNFEFLLRHSLGGKRSDADNAQTSLLRGGGGGTASRYCHWLQMPSIQLAEGCGCYSCSFGPDALTLFLSRSTATSKLHLMSAWEFQRSKRRSDEMFLGSMRQVAPPRISLPSHEIHAALRCPISSFFPVLIPAVSLTCRCLLSRLAVLRRPPLSFTRQG